MGVNGPLGVAGHAVASMLSEREALIVLSTVEGLGPATLARLLAWVGSARSVLDMATRPNAVDELMRANAHADGKINAMP